MSSLTGEFRPVATYYEMDSFDQEKVEKYLYMGCKVTTPFARVIRKSTWFALSTKKYCASGDIEECLTYDLSPCPKSTLDFFLNAWLRFRTPCISLKNTAAPYQAQVQVPTLTGVECRPVFRVCGALPTSTNVPLAPTNVPLCSPCSPCVQAPIIECNTVRTGCILVAVPPAAVGSPINVNPGSFPLATDFCTAAAVIATLTSGSPFFGVDPNDLVVEPVIVTPGAQRVFFDKNLVINWIESLKLKLNCVVVEEFDRESLKDHIQFRTSNEKRVNCLSLAGNNSLLNGYTDAQIGNCNPNFIPSQDVTLILPLSNSRDASTAIPFLNLCGNKVEIELKLAPITDVLVFEREVVNPVIAPIGSIGLTQDVEIGPNVPETVAVLSVAVSPTVVGAPDAGIATGIFEVVSRPSCVQLSHTPHYSHFNPCEFINTGLLKIEKPILFAEYATVTEDERRRHRLAGKCRSLLMEKIVPITIPNVAPGSRVEIPLHGIQGQTKAIFFKAANVTAQLRGDFNNYTNNSVNPSLGCDSITSVSLVYGNQQYAFKDFPADQFSKVYPLLHSSSQPDSVGFHAHFFTPNIDSLEPHGSIDLSSIPCSKLIIHTTPSALCPSFIDNNGCVSQGYPNTFQYQIEVRLLQWQVYNLVDDTITFC